MVEVIVEYDYTAKEPNELTIKKGDIIKDVLKKPGGWWEGVLKDKKGVFPDNFVRSMDKESITLRSRKDVSRIRQCRAVFSYNPLHEDELKLGVGDLINVIGEEEEGWWRGLLNGKEGVFPSNFVEEIIHPPKPTTREESICYSELDLKATKLTNKPAKQLCEVKYSYKAQNEDELTIKKGDIITLISKDQQDPGWWKGELNGDVGVFPDNFVVLISDEKSKFEKSEKKGDGDKKHEDDSAMKVTSVASQRQSLEPKTEKPSNESTNKTEKNNNEPPMINKTPPIPGKKPIIPIKKSPSSSTAGLFSEIKKKFVDVVDGGVSSKSSSSKTEFSEVKDNSTDNVFDQVERKQLLTDVRATRVKAPGRRLPTSIYKDEDPPNIPNGNVEHLLDTSDASHNTSSSSEPDEKPRLREWEKHKAPWLEEMKANQAKRTSTSPGPPSEGRIKLTPTGEIKSEDKEDVTPPAEKEIDMSKSMPPMDLSRSLSTSKAKPPHPGDKVEDKVSAIKAKPIVPPSSSIRQALTNRDPTTINRHTVSVPSSVMKDSLPAPAKIATTVSPKVPATIPPSIPPVTSTKVNSSTIAQKPEKEKVKAEISDTVSSKQYEDVLARLQKLEVLVEKQQEAIEDLRNKLQVESDLRMLLQEKMENYEV